MKDTPTQLLGVAVRKILKDRGLSYRTACEGTGLAHGHIQRLVKGEGSPTLDVLSKLAAGWDVPAWALIHPELHLAPDMAQEIADIITLYLSLDEDGKAYIKTTLVREAQRTPAKVPDISELGLRELDDQGNPITVEQSAQADK